MLLQFLCFIACTLCSATAIYDSAKTVLKLFKLVLYFIRIVFLFYRKSFGLCLNFLYSIRSIWDVVRLFVFLIKYLVSCTYYFSFFRTILELCEIFSHLKWIISVFWNYLHFVWTFMYSIISIWGVFRILRFVASIFCSAPTIFYSVRATLELSKVFRIS